MVVDHFSKYAHFITLGHPYTATTVARAFFSDIVHLHGMPNSIVSDRDPTFTSNLTELFKLYGVKLHMSMTFHPQSDRQLEAVNKINTMYLNVWQVIVLVSGCNGYLGPNTAIIQHSRALKMSPF
jgi:hypothetical protein